MTDKTKMNLEKLYLLHEAICDELYNNQGEDGDSGGRDDMRKGLIMLKTQIQHRIDAKVSILRGMNNGH